MNDTISCALRKFQVWGWRGVCSYLRKRVSDVFVRRELLERAKNNAGVIPERGVTVVAPLSMKYSNSKAVRDFVWGLKAAGIPFQTFDTNRRPEIPKEDYEPILTHPDDFILTRYSLVVEMFKSPLPKKLHLCRARIAFWEGETGMLDAFPYLASPEPVIAMSDFNLFQFRNELPAGTPVFKVVYPLPLDIGELESPKEVRKRWKIPPESFAVFYNFDLGSYFRKNPEAGIRAFAEAFSKEADACLVFKLKWADEHADKVARMKEIASRYGVCDRVHFVCDYLSRRDLLGLTNACDCYFSPHRAEGFGIGLGEAMLLGKPVVATDWSATTEFVLPEHAFPVPFTLVPVKAGEYFTSMGRWAKIDESAAAMALRRLYENPVLRTEKGRLARKFMLGHFSVSAFRNDVERLLDFSLTRASQA